MSIFDMLKHALEQDDAKTSKEGKAMTNFEKLTQAKTKEEAAKILFDYTTDFHFEKGKIDLMEWLDRENDTKQTSLRATTMLIRALLMGGENND